MEEPFERTIVLEDMIIRGENNEERISQMTKNMIAPELFRPSLDLGVCGW